MLKTYLMSVIMWWMILTATGTFANRSRKSRNIDFKKYLKNRKPIKVSYLLMACIPIIRLIAFGIEIFLAGADEKQLDILFNKED